MDLIIGGGISGLSYAYFSNNDFLILEKDHSIGGYCRTTKRNGFVWDYSGHFFHFQDAEIKDLMLSKMKKEEMIEVLKSTRIKYKDILVDYPFQKNIHQLPKEELIDCLYDLFAIDKSLYHNFQEMLYAKFGHSIAEKFLIPYNTKLYACNLNTLDKDAMGRFFPYAEKEDIIRNFKAEKDDSYNGTFLYPRGGAIEYIKSIADRIDQNKIRKEIEVVRIDKNKQIAYLNNAESISYDRLISTIPFPHLLEMSGIDYNKSIYTWNQVLVFNLGFDKKGMNKQDHWLYFPESKYCFYRVGFYDNILGQDRMSLYIELGFTKDDVINPNEWIGRVLKDLKMAGILSEEQILIDYESIVMNPAYVHINPKSEIDMGEKKKSLANHNIYSIGRYGSWTYCSIEDNIKEAKTLTDKLNKK